MSDRVHFVWFANKQWAKQNKQWEKTKQAVGINKTSSGKKQNKQWGKKTKQWEKTKQAVGDVEMDLCNYVLTKMAMSAFVHTH